MSWECPGCKSTNLKVCVEVWCNLVQNSEEDGDFETEETGHHQWDSESSMTCKDCGKQGNSHDFWKEPEEVQ